MILQNSSLRYTVSKRDPRFRILSAKVEVEAGHVDRQRSQHESFLHGSVCELREIRVRLPITCLSSFFTSATR